MPHSICVQSYSSRDVVSCCRKNGHKVKTHFLHTTCRTAKTAAQCAGNFKHSPYAVISVTTWTALHSSFMHNICRNFKTCNENNGDGAMVWPPPSNNFTKGPILSKSLFTCSYNCGIFCIANIAKSHCLAKSLGHYQLILIHITLGGCNSPHGGAYTDNALPL